MLSSNVSSRETIPPKPEQVELPEVPCSLIAGRKLFLVLCAFILSISLTYLDQTIISTALPTIASHFNAVNDLSWISGGYFLPQTAFVLLIGKILSITAVKPVLLFSIGLFEVGSLLCALAPSVNCLILGRVISGVGGAGIWVSILSCLAQITTIKQRPILMSIMGAMYAVSAIGGPLLGGVFSDKVSWRWCFYINIPIGSVALVILIFILPYTPPPENSEASLLQKWLKLDWFGSVLSIAMATMLYLPLQWGGNTKSWNDPAVIATLTLFVVLLAAFVLCEYYRGEDAMLPLHLFKNMSMVGACLEGFMISACFVIATYYLPFLYQILGHSAARSGIDILPLMISGIITCVATGAIVTIFGIPWPFLFCFPPIAAVAFGLLFAETIHTSSARLIGYQILVGVGLGPAIQTVVVVVQVVWADQKSIIPLATAIITFMQVLGSSVGLAISQAIFSSQLRKNVDSLNINLSPQLRVLVLSNVKAVFQLPEAEKNQILLAYNIAVVRVFLAGVVASALAVLFSLLISRKRITDSVNVNNVDS